MAEIYNRGSVSVSFNVYADFPSYKSGMLLIRMMLQYVLYAFIIFVGVYRYTSGKYLGRHCVKVFGWGVENNVPYW